MSVVEGRLVELARAKANQKLLKRLPLIDWGRKYAPAYFERPFSRAHPILADRLDDLTKNRGKKMAVKMPRGYAKSTFCSFLKPLQAVCEGTERYILLGAKSEDLAAKYLDSIKTELETNERLHADYPLACERGKTWNNSRIETGNGCCIEIFGKGTSVRGRKYGHFRPTLIVGDDLQETDDVFSPATRVADMEWYSRSLVPCGDTYTNYFLIGNALHQESIVSQCSLKPDYDTLEFSAIDPMPTNMSLWEEWESMYLGCRNEKDKAECRAFFDSNKEAMLLGAAVLWEEKEDLYALMCMRATLGHAVFAAEKQNSPRDPGKCEFPEEWFSDDVFYSKLPEGEESVRVGYNDPSKGKQNRKRDYSPIISLHYYPKRNECYIEADVRRIPLTELTDTIVNFHRQINYHAFGVETNGFAELIGNELVAKLEAEGLYLPISAVENYIIKQRRISRLSVWLKRKFFRFKRNCPHTALLLAALKEHPFAQFDDAPDALEGALRILTSISTLDNDNSTISAVGDDGLGDNILGALGL